MSAEKKETNKICDICNDTGLVHATFGWKDYSFWCPKCRRSKFLQGIKQVNLSEESALGIINNHGVAGDG